MNIGQFRRLLADAPAQHLELRLPTGESVPAHFHITEVGKVTRDFIDCGGTRRSEASCVLQTLVAHDVDHRLSTSKLAGILEKSSSLGIEDSLEVEVEVQGASIEVYGISDSKRDDGTLCFTLKPKQTACLALDKCGLNVVQNENPDCCESSSGCC